MDPNRTYLLAQNGVPGEYTVSYPFIVRAPPSTESSQSRQHSRNKSIKPRDSGESFNSIEREKEESYNQPERTSTQSLWSKVARKLSGTHRSGVEIGEGTMGEKRDVGIVMGPHAVKREESVKQHASAANKEKVESTKNACTIPGEKCHDTTSKGEEAENKDD